MSAISSSRVVITMCPASMLAKSRIMRAKGFVNMLRISTGIMIGSSHAGRPGRHQVLEVADDPVLRDPRVLLGDEGDEGEGHRHRDVAGRGGRQSTARIEAAGTSAATRMKKKKLHSSGVYFRPSPWPMFVSAISSRMKSTRASTAAPSPRGIWPPR